MNRLLTCLTLSLALLMTGCASQSTGWLSPDSLYPEAITQCRDEPVVPPRPAPGLPRLDEDKARYDRDLHGAWADCHDAVEATAERKRLYRDQYDRATESGLKRFLRFGR